MSRDARAANHPHQRARCGSSRRTAPGKEEDKGGREKVSERPRRGKHRRETEAGEADGGGGGATHAAPSITES